MKFSSLIHSLGQLQSVKAFMLALSLLTRLPTLPVSSIQPSDSGRSVLFYPLVGWLIGLFLYVPMVLFPSASPLLIAAIIVTLWAMITGGLHLDGLADSSDAWLGGMGDHKKIHSIMKDPLVGAAGVVSIVCLLLLKYSALITLLLEMPLSQSWIIIFAPVVGRSAILLLFLTTQYASANGLATEIVECMPRKLSWWLMGLVALLGLFISISGMVLALIGFWLLRRMMLKQLNGCTGDTAGATVEITEMFWLLGVALI